LDAWRGLMLVIMAAYHLGGPLGTPVRQVFGYVSAAEGFVLLSGLMSGLVYGRYAKAGFATLRDRMWRRACTIYRYHIVVILIIWGFVAALAVVSPGMAEYYRPTDFEIVLDHPWPALPMILLGLYAPAMFGILGLYVAYMAAAPFVIEQFRRGHAPMVFLGSAALWLFAQAGGSVALASLLPGRAYMELAPFDIFAWQTLFVAGAYVGWRHLNGLSAVPFFGPRVFWGALAIAAALFVARHWGAGLVPTQDWTASIAELSWLRIVDTAAVALSIYGLARVYGIQFRSPWLELLGRNALPVFAAHGVAIYLAVPVRWRIQSGGVIVEVLGLVAFLAVLTAVALLYEQSKRAARTPVGNLDMAGRQRYI
jgi:hypothetical protein